ncbi:ubiquitin carboxyl-terminal hydrolase isozyme l3, partial [Moniliophthora roreri]
HIANSIYYIPIHPWVGKKKKENVTLLYHPFPKLHLHEEHDSDRPIFRYLVRA